MIFPQLNETKLEFEYVVWRYVLKFEF